ncbi:hypothetical protein GOV03_05145 [Candidatus Woesearchaeota archaeon]|nr:hypothetical protein [Candidatus Woesearchaeota archaeon]
MSLSDTIKKILVNGVVLTALVVLPNSIMNASRIYTHGYETKEEKNMYKMDGIFASTEVNIKRTGEVRIMEDRGLFRKDIVYTENDGDGLVDQIVERSTFWRSGPSLERFDREKDYGDFPEKFDEADKYLSEQLERFELK